MAALTAEELAMLTDEEREGYEEDEDIDPEVDPEVDPELGPDVDPEPSVDPKVGPEVDPKADPEPKVETDPEPDVNAPLPKPLFNAELPADLEAKRTGLNTKEDELVTKFDNGDITFAEYHKELRSLNNERSQLDRLELKSELAQEAQQSQIDNTWQNTAVSFVNAHPLISKNETMWNSFDIVLRRVTSEVMAKGEQPGPRELDKAYKQWAEDLGIQAETPKAQPAPTVKKETIVPPNLGKLPAATATDTEDGKWAHLDRLADSDPLAYEAAMLRLSDAERDEYTRAG